MTAPAKQAKTATAVPTALGETLLKHVMSALRGTVTENATRLKRDFTAKTVRQNTAVVTASAKALRTVATVPLTVRHRPAVMESATVAKISVFVLPTVARHPERRSTTVATAWITIVTVLQTATTKKIVHPPAVGRTPPARKTTSAAPGIASRTAPAGVKRRYLRVRGEPLVLHGPAGFSKAHTHLPKV